jgi:hypothetical protein
MRSSLITVSNQRTEKPPILTGFDKYVVNFPKIHIYVIFRSKHDGSLRKRKDISGNVRES